MKEKKQLFKNAQILTPQETRELTEFIPIVYCGNGKNIECPSGTQNWQMIGLSITSAEGLRCDNQIYMCNGGIYSGSGSSSDYSFCNGSDYPIDGSGSGFSNT